MWQTPYVLNASALFWLIEISRFSELVSSIAYNQAGNLTLERYFPELNFTGTNRLTKQHAAKVWALLSAPGGVQNVQQVGGTGIVLRMGAPCSNLLLPLTLLLCLLRFLPCAAV